MASLCHGLRSLLLGPALLTRQALHRFISPRTGTCSFHLATVLSGISNGVPSEPVNWPRYNDIVYPPQAEGDPIRPAEVVHFRANVKYSQKKMWYIASMIRGMSIDEAIKQLRFVKRKGSVVIREVLEEAQQMAVADHNVEYKSNLWVSDSRVGKAHTIKGVRKHARRRYGHVDYRYTHYLVRLREGTPPKHYFTPEPTGNEKMKEYIGSLRGRRIHRAL